MPPAKRNNNNRLQRDAYTLTVRQSPEVGKALSGKEKDRKPIDPPPIVQLQIRDYSDPAQNYLQSPYYMCICSLWDATNDEPAQDPTLCGTLVSSLHRLKDLDNSDAGFFVFPDLSVKVDGEFRLKFVLWELLDGECQSLQSIISKPFRVHQAKTFPGLAESTILTRTFSDQGVRLRIRKETRSAMKRPPSDPESSSYGTHPDTPGLAGPYGQPNPYHSGGYGGEYVHSLVKRQKSANSSSYGDREGWAQPSPGLYGHPSHSQVSGYYQDSVSSAPQMDYGFRSAPGGDASLTQSYYQRNALPEYGQSTQPLPYHNQPRSTHADVTNGTNSYGDTSSFGHLGGADTAHSSSYRYNMPGSAMHTLPPIASTTQSSGQVLTSPSYPNYAADGRYTGHASMSSGGRPTYNYPGQASAYQAPANYT